MKPEGTGARRWGFAATIILAIVAWGISVIQVQRAREEVRILARTADRSTFLVGEVGRHVSRLRAAALERLAFHDRDLTRTDEDVRAVTVGLDDAVRELEPL